MISVDNTILGEVEVTILPLVSADDDIPLLTEIKNFPNPFQANGSRGTGTTISFSFNSGTKILNEPAEVSVYNMKGQLVRKLNTDLNSAHSSYTVHWDGRNKYGTIAESGIYLYTISVQDHIFKGKMTLLK
jgi:flagellar hook capping protein FlgD